jgi:hypothetical protein
LIGHPASWLGIGDLQLNGCRKLDVEGGPLVDRDSRVLALEHEVRGFPDGGIRNVQLVVGGGVHEDVVLAVLVEVLHLALVDTGCLDLDASVERPVDDLAGQDVLQFGADEGAALARLDVLELDDRPQAAVEVEDQTVLEVVGGGHSAFFSSMGSWPSGVLSRRPVGRELSW